MNKVYIIAEIGVNHNGKLALAKKMIKAAKKSGADAVKFQSFRTEEFMANKQIIYKYNKSKEKMYSMFQRLEFQNHWYNILSKYCKQIKIDFITSIADSESLKNYLKINPKFIKLSSEDLINYPLLKTLSKIKKTIVVSTGMADEIEIKTALNILKKNKIIILHCVSLYPTSLKNINLNRIVSLKKFGFPVGFSDHTVGIKASIYAVLLGAKIIEKHFTINKNLKGPDHKISSDPKELSLLVKEVRLISKIIGDGEINPKNKEINIRKKFRRSIVASEKIEKNGVIM
jgi:sialic acid synthase SpsE